MKIFFTGMLALLSLMSLNSPLNAANDSNTFNSTSFEEFAWGSNLANYPQLDCIAPSRLPSSAETYCTHSEKTIEFLGVDTEHFRYSMNKAKQFDYVIIRPYGYKNLLLLKEKLIDILGENYTGYYVYDNLTHRWEKDSLIIELVDWDPTNKGKNKNKDKDMIGVLTIKNKSYYTERPFSSMMHPCNLQPCNLYEDHICDDKDLEILIKSLGQCDKPGNHFYNPNADFDKDNCITEKDRKIMEEAKGTEGYDCTASGTSLGF